MRVNKAIKKEIFNRLNNSALLNIFGLVNLAIVRTVDGTDKYSDEELRQAVIDLFDDSVIGGVQFKDEPRR